MNVSRRAWLFQGAKFILVHTGRPWEGAVATWGGWGQRRQRGLMKAEPRGCCWWAGGQVWIRGGIKGGLRHWQVGPLSRCGEWASHWGGFLWAPVAVAHGLSCSVTRGILVPRPEIKPVSPALAGGFFFFFNLFILSGG